jgi:hypothetical protein
MTVFRGKDSDYEMDDEWFDHSPSDYAELLRRHGIS